MGTRQSKKSARAVGLAAFSVAMLAALAIPLSAAAENVVNATIPLPTSVMTDPCAPGATASLHGELHLVMTSTTDARGGTHVGLYMNTKLTGQTAHPFEPPITYQGSTTDNSTAYLDSPSSTATQTVQTELVSQAATDNWLSRIRLHVTVNANGYPTATVDRATVECNG